MQFVHSEEKLSLQSSQSLRKGECPLESISSHGWDISQRATSGHNHSIVNPNCLAKRGHTERNLPEGAFSQRLRSLMNDFRKVGREEFALKRQLQTPLERREMTWLITRAGCLYTAVL